MTTCPIFTVPDDGQSAIVVRGYGFLDGESYEIEHLACPHCDDRDTWAPYMPTGTQVLLSATRNPIVITIPGQYRAVPLDGTCDATVCTELIKVCCK